MRGLGPYWPHQHLRKLAVAKPPSLHHEVVTCPFSIYQALREVAGVADKVARLQMRTSLVSSAGLECAGLADAGPTHVALGAIPIVAAITIASRFVNINMFTSSAVSPLDGCAEIDLDLLSISYS
jgi:hypothetical protein